MIVPVTLVTTLATTPILLLVSGSVNDPRPRF
jgi:hypothetical protein